MIHSWVSHLKTLGDPLSWQNVLLGLVSGGQVVLCQNVVQKAMDWQAFHQPLRTIFVAFSLWYERLVWITPFLWHRHLASLSVSSLISIPLWPRTQVMCIWESSSPYRSLSVCLEKRMESCWDGWVCMREMLEIAEELLEKKAMDLIWGALFAKCLATDIPTARVKDSPSYVHVGPPPKAP